MKKTQNKHKIKVVLALTASILAAGAAQAYEVPLTWIGTNMPPIDFHGFISQGFLDSSKYNYLGDTTRGSFLFSEMGINASMNPFPRTRIAIQGFDFTTGNVGQYDPILDYALVEYTFNDEVGVRAGRIRRPSGIYNAIQDIDLARTYVLLPQGMYDSRWRDWSASLDGGEIFGAFSLGKAAKAGSLSYEAYAGVVNMADNGGPARYIENGLPPAPYGQFNGIDSTPIFGGQLWYNTPIDGLRFGASLAYMQNWGYSVSVPVPGLGITDLHGVGNIVLQQYSAEYLWKQWTFQAEYYTYDLTGHQYLSAYNNAVAGVADDNPQTWYVAASRRLNKYFELGTYYTEYRDFSTSSNNSDGHQNDVALTLRVDPFSWWTFKVEVHHLDGTALLREDSNNPQPHNGDGWFMVAVKTTFSF